jgi:hypothetical protein
MSSARRLRSSRCDSAEALPRVPAGGVRHSGTLLRQKRCLTGLRRWLKVITSGMGAPNRLPLSSQRKIPDYQGRSRLSIVACCRRRNFATPVFARSSRAVEVRNTIQAKVESRGRGHTRRTRISYSHFRPSTRRFDSSLRSASCQPRNPSSTLERTPP